YLFRKLKWRFLRLLSVFCVRRIPRLHVAMPSISEEHKSTLHSNGIYLICSCGLEVHSHHVEFEHTVNCDGLQFTHHKLEETPKCVLCEAYPSSASGYAQHLMKHHKSTLNK
ncbi:hypothetical protein PENTCL1PPCAC_3971, partial [Pristionchus entomophagus]